jgi:hypothetical protein
VPASIRAFALVAAVIVAGCGRGEASESTTNGPVIDCLGVPAQQCREAVDEAIATAGGESLVTAVTVRCNAASCTARDGQLTVAVTLANGESTSWGTRWSALGPPIGQDDGLPVPATCEDVPLVTCLDFAKTAIQDQIARPVDQVVGITVRCAAGTVCDADAGEGSTEVLFRDGTKHESHWAYEEPIGP